MTHGPGGRVGGVSGNHGDPPGERRRSDEARTFSTGAEADAAVRATSREHRTILLRYLRRFTGDQHRAEDLLQETLLRAWRHPEARTDRGDWPLPWLYTVARRVAIDFLRTDHLKAARFGVDDLIERADEHDHIERLLVAREVHAALASLPLRLREVLVHVYLGDRTIADTAALLGLPEGTVKSRTYHALRALREVLHQRGFDSRSG
jgi:RNA polymerase sigma-70 factor, ECF subfamily